MEMNVDAITSGRRDRRRHRRYRFPVSRTISFPKDG